MREYVHYGHKKFLKKYFQPIRNAGFFPKPNGGFWASRNDAEYGWKEWNEVSKWAECSEDNCFKFYISDDANVVTIHSVDDLKDLPDEDSPDGIKSGLKIIDFEKLLSVGVDAVEVLISEDFRLYHELYGWDCDSIVIMNPNIIVKK